MMPIHFQIRDDQATGAAVRRLREEISRHTDVVATIDIWPRDNRVEVAARPLLSDVEVAVAGGTDLEDCCDLVTAALAKKGAS